MSGPTINRGESSGDIWTPQAFINAVEKKFGPLFLDLAASGPQSTKAPRWVTPEQDSLSITWADFVRMRKDGPCTKDLLWLNPPFSNITLWARKCAKESQEGAQILLLVPGSIGANWYWNHVEPFAKVYSVGRMVFDNCFDRKTGELVTTPYAKDLILAHYLSYPQLRKKRPDRMERWRWQDGI